MLVNLLTGLPVMLLCLLLQAIFVAKCLRHYVHFRHAHQDRDSQLLDILLLSMVMVLMLLGDFVSALYHSGVNFATLGYGDIVMSERWRLLGPLEAANGILMFGVSTSVMTAAVMDVIKHSMERLQQREHL